MKFLMHRKSKLAKPKVLRHRDLWFRGPKRFTFESSKNSLNVRIFERFSRTSPRPEFNKTPPAFHSQRVGLFNKKIKNFFELF